MKRRTEEPNVLCKRQVIEIEQRHSPMSFMLTDALTSWAGLRALLPGDVPTTRDEILKRFEPLLWKSSEVALKLGLALTIASPPHPQLLPTVARSWELVSISIHRVKEAVALPLYPQTSESLAAAVDRLRRVSAVLDRYCKPLQNFNGTVSHFHHLGLVPALSATNALINTLVGDLVGICDVLAAGPSSSHTFHTGPVIDLVTVTPRGDLLFECVSCLCCPIYLPDDQLEATCGYCQCPARFHSPTAPVFVRDLLLDEDDLQEAEEFPFN